MPEEQLTRTTPSMTPDEVTGRSFPPARRGYDPDSVRRFLEEVAGAIRAYRAREEHLASRLVEAERRAASPELDEATLTAAVGAETAKVLRAAHEAARDVVARAEARAVEIVAEASGVLAERTREADAEARALAARARAEAAALLEATTSECRSMVDEAREARRRILADLAERRRGLHLQLEQLRAGKDSLVAVVEATARSVEDVRARLADAEALARVAADRVGDSAVLEESSVESLLAEARSLPPVDADDGADDAAVTQVVADDAGSDDAGGSGGAPGAGGRGEGARGAAPRDVASGGGEGDAGEPGTTGAGEEEGPSEDGVGRGHGATSRNAVDELFAKLRAASVSTSGPEEEPPAVRAVDPPAARDEPQEGADGTDAAVEAGDEETSGSTDEGAEADELAISARDEAVAVLHAELARVVKRELRSSQNELLDAIRNLARGEAVDGLLPGEEEAERLAATVTPLLLAAFRSGEKSAVGPGAAEGEGSPGGPDAAAAGARELAGLVVSSIRARLDGELGKAEDVAASTEVVGAAYREWRGEKVEDVVSDHLARAFNEGAFASAGEGASVRWVVDDGDSHCPDCDDNALAGRIAAGEAFPTGQVHPPVHAGCRCLLVVVRD